MTEEQTQEPKYISDDEMLSAVSELLVSTRVYQNRSARHYANELAARIVDAMSDEAKVKVAELVSRHSNPPEELLRDLVSASTEAATVILSARHVTDAVLMESASKSMELREIIARRPQLSEPVVNKLLFHEESQIENILLTRPEIQLSNSRAARLISRVDRESTLGWLLAKRTDLSPRLSLRLFWRVDGESRAAILKQFNVDPGFAAQIFTRLLQKGERPARADALGAMAKLVAGVLQMERGAAEPSVHITDLQELRARAQPAMIQAVADEANITYRLGQMIAEDHLGDAFAVLCRALGITEKNFSKLAAVKPPKPAGTAPLTQDDVARLKKVFADLTPSAAIAVLSYWEIDIVKKERADLQRKLALDLDKMQKLLTAEYGEAEETGDDPAARETPAPRHKRLGIF